MDPNIVVTKTPTLGNSSSVTTAPPSVPGGSCISFSITINIFGKYITV